MVPPEARAGRDSGAFRARNAETPKRPGRGRGVPRSRGVCESRSARRIHRRVGRADAVVVDVERARVVHGNTLVEAHPVLEPRVLAERRAVVAAHLDAVAPLLTEAVRARRPLDVVDEVDPLTLGDGPEEVAAVGSRTDGAVEVRAGAERRHTVDHVRAQVAPGTIDGRARIAEADAAEEVVAVVDDLAEVPVVTEVEREAVPTLLTGRAVRHVRHELIAPDRAARGGRGERDLEGMRASAGVLRRHDVGATETGAFLAHGLVDADVAVLEAAAPEHRAGG